MLTKQEADKLIKIRGESRGVNIKIDLDYVLEKQGKPGLKKVEAKMTELGYPIKYKDIKQMGFYPLGLEAVVLLCIRDILNLDEEGVEKMGAAVVKFSIFMKILMKYFGSLSFVAKEVPKNWKEHYTVGSLEMTDFKEGKNGYAILRQKNFKIHPVYCAIHRGYFKKVAQMVVKSTVSCEETKNVFKGDKYNEFVLTWI